jgi:protoheme IX farnesyltransferase
MDTARNMEALDSPAAGGVVVAMARPRIADYVELTKPRIGALVLITTIVGFVAASDGDVAVARLLHTILGTALAAAGANALNQYLERDRDALMHRTAGRPIPSGRVPATDALLFGLAACALGVAYLSLLTNPLAGLVAFATIASYVLLYTPLKRVTPWCTAVGAIPGALPPVIGWTAARGHLDPGAALLFAILFVWQIPHFWAIAWLYRDDYRRAGFPMLPVIDLTGRRTGRQAIVLCSALLPLSVAPWWLGLTGAWYLGGAVLLGLAFLGFAVRFARCTGATTARRLMLMSIAYLPLLLGLWMVDR